MTNADVAQGAGGFPRSEAERSGRLLLIPDIETAACPAQIDRLFLVDPYLDALARHAQADLIPAAIFKAYPLCGVVLGSMGSIDVGQANDVAAPASQDLSTAISGAVSVRSCARSTSSSSAARLCPSLR